MQPDQSHSTTQTPAAPGDPWRSVHAIQTAYVHIALRGAPRPAHRRMLEPDPHTLSAEEFRFALARSIATFLGQPARCRSAACQRAKVCRGLPPDCWQDEPPPTHQEIMLAKLLMRYHFDKIVPNLGGDDADEPRTPR